MLVGQRGPPLRIALRFVQCARRAADCSLRSPAGDACVWRGQPCGMIAAPADSEVQVGGCVPAPACGGSPCCWCHGMCHPLTRRAWGGEPGVGQQQAVPAQGAVERAAPGSTLPPLDAPTRQQLVRKAAHAGAVAQREEPPLQGPLQQEGLVLPQALHPAGVVLWGAGR